MTLVFQKPANVPSTLNFRVGGIAEPYMAPLFIGLRQKAIARLKSLNLRAIFKGGHAKLGRGCSTLSWSRRLQRLGGCVHGHSKYEIEGRMGAVQRVVPRCRRQY